MLVGTPAAAEANGLRSSNAGIGVPQERARTPIASLAADGRAARDDSCRPRLIAVFGRSRSQAQFKIVDRHVHKTNSANGYLMTRGPFAAARKTGPRERSGGIWTNVGRLRTARASAGRANDPDYLEDTARCQRCGPCAPIRVDNAVAKMEHAAEAHQPRSVGLRICVDAAYDQLRKTSRQRRRNQPTQRCTVAAGPIHRRRPNRKKRNGRSCRRLPLCVASNGRQPTCG